MERQGNGKTIEIFLNNRIRFIIDDKNRVIARDGILRGYDEVNYYLELLHGIKKGKIFAFLKKSIRRIEPLDENMGDNHFR